MLDNKYFEPYFKGTNFGSKKYAHLITEGLIKISCGYHVGMTMKGILKNIELIDFDGKGNRWLTHKGKVYLYRLYQGGK
jgi:predicted P-loop ATPase